MQGENKIFTFDGVDSETISWCHRTLLDFIKSIEIGGYKDLKQYSILICKPGDSFADFPEKHQFVIFDNCTQNRQQSLKEQLFQIADLCLKHGI